MDTDLNLKSSTVNKQLEADQSPEVGNTDGDRVETNAAAAAASAKPDVSSDIEKLVQLGFSDLSIENLIHNKFHYGCQTSMRNPLVSPYVFSSKKGVDVVDVVQTAELFKVALQAVRSCVSKRGKVLFVGTTPHAADCVQQVQHAGQFYVAKRWIGGLLTNWSHMSKIIRNMTSLKVDIDNNKFKDYTKKEVSVLNKKYASDHSFFAGVEKIHSLPDMIVVTSHKERVAVQEARKLSIPVVALLDTDANPTGINYVVPGNSSSSLSIQYFVGLLMRACLLGMYDAQQVQVVKQKKIESKQANSQKTNKTKPVGREVQL